MNREQKYLIDGRCPKCGGHDLIEVRTDAGSGVAEAELKCGNEDCGASWVEHYLFDRLETEAFDPNEEVPERQLIGETHD